MSEQASQSSPALWRGTIAGFGLTFDAQVTAAALRMGVLPQLEPAYRLTQAIFPRLIAIDVVEDPEVPDETRIVFRVESVGPLDAIVEQHVQWCRKILELPRPAAELFCLSIDAQP